jgi:hypothetical protein
MTKSIPASYFVSIVPGVISAGGSALDLNGLMLTSGTRTPIGSVLSFASASAVATYYGAGSTEAQAAAIYFAGFDNSNVKPGALLVAQYNTAPVAAFLRGASVSSLTLAQLQALTPGTLTITTDGVAKTSGTITLSGATSFSNAATLIQAAFTSPNFAVSFDSVSGAFVFTSSTTGAASTITFCTGTLADPLNLRLVDGAVLSQGAIAAVPGTFMTAITGVTQDWASFFTTFDPDNGSGNAQKLLFAQWNNAQVDQYVYVAWDTDTSPTTTSPATTSLGYLLKQANIDGTFLIYAPSYDKAAYQSGAIAAVDFSETNGRTNFDFRSQAGLTPDVTDLTTLTNLEANGYNAYCAVATRNQGFTFMTPGSVPGQWLWLDSYVNQIWLNAALQLAGMELLVALKSIPYNAPGRALIRAAFMDPINAGVNFGAIQPGVTLSALQIAEVNNAAGTKIDTTLSAQGWYLQILDATPQNRALRKSPRCTLWYTDGGSVNQINLASVDVQ